MAQHCIVTGILCDMTLWGMELLQTTGPLWITFEQEGGWHVDLRVSVHGQHMSQAGRMYNILTY